MGEYTQTNTELGVVMNTVPASEIKRRGVAALDEALKSGPVHIIKNNRPRYVVLSEEAYQALTVGCALPEEMAPDGRDVLSSIKLGVAEGRYTIPEPDAAEDANVAALFQASEVFPPMDGDA